MKIKQKKIISATANILIAAILLIGAVFAFSLLPVKNNYKFYSVMSGSMMPKIQVGSLAIVIPQSEYHIGDIITFISYGSSSDKQTTTHRVVSISSDGGQPLYTTKGDANESPDAKPVLKNRVIGRYLGGIDELGFFLNHLNSLPGLAILIFIPALIIIVEEIKNIFHEVKNIKQKRKTMALER